MKKTLSLLLAAAMLLGMAGCGAEPNQADTPQTNVPVEAPADPAPALDDPGTAYEPVTLTNVFGEEEVDITYTEEPQRVVSLAGFATEMLLALGLEDRIVGYAWQDNEVLPQYADAFAKLSPLCDPGQDPGEEVVLAAQPDLVLSWASWSDEDYFNYKNLEKHGIQTYGFHSERHSGGKLEDVYTDFLNLGKIFHVEDKAQALVDEMRGRIDAVAERMAEEEPVRVFVCDSSSTMENTMTVAGGLPQEILEKAGGANVFTDGNSNWQRNVSWEVIAAANPEWIVIDYYASAQDGEPIVELLREHPAMKTCDAVVKDQIIIIGLTDISCSERIDDCVELLASHFHPEV